MLITIFLIIGLRIVQDILFLTKIDAFNRNNRLYSSLVNLVEATYGFIAIRFILQAMDTNYFLVIFVGIASMIGGLLSSIIKKKLDDKLEGQRKFFVRISLDDSKDRTEFFQELGDHNFDFAVEEIEYTSGAMRTVVSGSIKDRQRMWELKDILRGRPGKHLVILRAEDIIYPIS